MVADETSIQSWTCPTRRVALLGGVSVIVVAFLTQLFGNAFSIHNFGVLSLSSLDVFTKASNSPRGTTKDDEAAATMAATPSEIWEDLWDKMGLRGSLAEQQQQQQRTNNGSVHLTLTTLGASVKDLSLQELFGVFPSPVQPEIMQIYNQTTYQDLVQSLVAVRNNKDSTVTICANGGSASAGGGGIAMPGRYFSILARYLRGVVNYSGSNTHTAGARARARRIRAVNRAHGSRHSLHTAVFAPYQLPYNTDLLLWEFAINDCGYKIPEDTRAQQERSMLLAWLREVEQLQPRPPKVILIYLWRAPFSLANEQRVHNPVFASHENLARQFDFVVGHVNLASYLDELGLPDFDSLKEVFLADAHHPNQAGHSAIAFLLMHLLRGTGSWSNSTNANSIDTVELKNNFTSPSSHHPHGEGIERYNWHCGNGTKQKRFLQSRVVSQPQSGGGDTSNSGWRSPLGTLTLEMPQNEQGSRRRQLILDSTGHNVTFTILGKQDPVRNDLQRSAAMECCSFSSNDANKNDAFATIRLANSTDPPMRGVQAIFFGFGKEASEVGNIKVYLNGEPTSTAATLLPVVPKKWPCFWSWQDIYRPYWLILSEEQPSVSSMSFCVKNKNCRSNRPSDAMLLSIAVY